jgi:hypothetical protein
LVFLGRFLIFKIKSFEQKKMRMWIKVILMIAVLALLINADGGADKEMMRNAMEHLLQIRAPISGAQRIKRADYDDISSSSDSSSSSTTSSPHLYMMELYKKYLTSDSMKTRSNTIRSIIPSRGKT